MGKGRRYNQEYKDMILDLFKSGMSLAELSSEYGIAKSTRNMSSKEKFLIVMETYTLSETELQNITEKMAYMLNKSKTGELASKLIERAMLSEKVKIKGNKKQLVLHSDNGVPMKFHTLKSKLEMLGVLWSYSRPRVSNDNPYSEAHFKTMKYKASYPQDGFKSLEEACEWVAKFVNWYNNEHYHSGLNYLTPNSRHNGDAEEIMKNKIKVYEAALNPLRFKKEIRNWSVPDKVELNPTDEVKEKN